MRFSKLIAQSVRLLSVEEAQAYVGGPQLLSLMEENGWVKPSCREHRLTRYDCKVLDAACDRLLAGDFPGKAVNCAPSK